ncbi:MAG: hypothetical protein NWF06_10370 [Candidatus Bathyarchaeota archaeon]|nr:hypothetical protein [Candidatus Bathyarchaeum sp.]
MNKISALFWVFALIFSVGSGYVWVVDADAVSGFDGAQTGFTIVVNYEEGDPVTYEHAVFSLAPFEISDSSGRTIESIDIYLYATLNTEGTVSSWSVSGGQQVEVYKGSETAPKTSSTIEISESGSSWSSGERKQISFVSLHWSQIEAAVQQYGAGDWTIQVLADLQISVEFSDGSEDIASASTPGVCLSFTYSSSPMYSITGWSLSLSNDVSTLSFSGDFAANYGLPSWILHLVLPLAAAVCFGIGLFTYKEGGE